MKNRRLLIISIIAVLLAVAVVGTVYAVLKGRSGVVTNNFAADSDLDPVITETFADNLKSGVKVQIGDTGYSVYVRATVIVNWQDSAGNVYPVAPVKGIDYTISMNDGENDPWFEDEDSGIWYHKTPVVSNGETAVLIDECTQKSAAPEAGYQLHVEILSQTVQAAGKTAGDDDTQTQAAVEDAWGVTVGANGILLPASSGTTQTRDPILGPEF